MTSARASSAWPSFWPMMAMDWLWYRVLACYRLGLILEGTHARACAGLAPRAIGDQLHAHTVSLLGQAVELIG